MSFEGLSTNTAPYLAAECATSPAEPQGDRV